MICPHCGQSCPDDAVFCPNCGKTIEPQSAPENQVREGTLPGAGMTPQNTQQNPAAQQYNPQQNPQYGGQYYPQYGQQYNSQYGQPYNRQANPQYGQYNPQANPQYGQPYAPQYGTYYTPQPYQPMTPSSGVPQNETTAKVIATLKSVASSPLFLVAAILFSVSVLLSFISSFVPSNQASEYLYYFADILEELDMGDIVYDIYETSAETDIASAIIGIVPSALLIAGMWMTYASAINRNSNFMKTSGLTMIKVIVVIELVALCVVFGLLELVLLFVLAAGAGFGAPEELVIIAIGAMIGVAIAMTLMIVYFAKISKTVRVVKSTAATGIPAGNVSLFVAILNFIIGGSGALSNLTSIGFGVLPALSGICSSVALIFFGVIIIMYRNKMQAFMTPWAWQQPVPAYVQQVPGANQSYQGAQQSYYQNGTGTDTYAQNSAPQPSSNTVTCPNCREQCDAQASVCPHCGMSLKKE